MRLYELTATIRERNDPAGVLKTVEGLLAGSSLHRELGMDLEKSVGKDTINGELQVYVRSRLSSGQVADTWSISRELIGTTSYIRVVLMYSGRATVDNEAGAGAWFSRHIRPLAHRMLEVSDFIMIPVTNDWISEFPSIDESSSEMVLYGHETALREYLVAKSDPRDLASEALWRFPPDFVIIPV